MKVKINTEQQKLPLSYIRHLASWTREIEINFPRFLVTMRPRALLPGHVAPLTQRAESPLVI